MKRSLSAVLITVLVLFSTIAQAGNGIAVLDPPIGYVGIGGYDYTGSGEVIRTPLEAITRAQDSPIYVTQSFKTLNTPNGTFYGGYWMGIGVALGDRIKPYAEWNYDLGSAIWNGITGQTTDNIDRYFGYGIRFEGEKMGLALYYRNYSFGDSYAATQTGLNGDYRFTGMTIYFRTQ